MSDEAHMESAWRHRDRTALEQWHGAQPDEALMAAEDGDLEADFADADYYWLLEALCVYLFANNNARAWQGVAVRALFVIRRCAIWLLADESTTAELKRLNSQVVEWDMFGVEDFMRLCEDDNYREALAKILKFLYPPRKNRLYRGTMRVYLVALAYLPHLVRVDGEKLTYEQLAMIFEGVPLESRVARSRARSRWSARVQEVLRKPIEQAGGTVRLQFGKSAVARAKMQQSAKGNQNRRGGVER
jgi:hypothetical protein